MLTTVAGMVPHDFEAPLCDEAVQEIAGDNFTAVYARDGNLHLKITELRRCDDPGLQVMTAAASATWSRAVK